MEKWIRARYQPNLPLDGDRRVTASPEHIALSRQAAQEGAVLLKNNGGLLPLAPDTRVALFGKGSFDYVKGGGGSGDGHTLAQQKTRAMPRMSPADLLAVPARRWRQGNVFTR